MKITEFSIINKYLKKLTFNNKNSLNLSDDIYIDKKHKFIFSTDTYEENIHFINPSNPKKFVKKIFRSAISDIYSKGAVPKTYFLSLSVNKLSKKWLTDFKNELLKDSKKYNLFLGGGDTIKSKKLSINISVIGSLPKNIILRNGAKYNDDIHVTGYLGESYLGLLASQKKLRFSKYNKYFIDCFERPKIPIKFAKNLSKFASSSMDISDGLINDLKKLCSSSKVGASIDLSKIKNTNKAQQVCLINKIKIYEILSRGDDYQILFTAHKKFRNLIKLISLKTNTKVSLIGKITASKGVKVNNNDKRFKLSSFKSGFIHKF